MYGTQTSRLDIVSDARFENDVKMYGTQTCPIILLSQAWFENDVKMYGTQTSHGAFMGLASLRMM